MPRSLVTIDVGAIRRNATRLADIVRPAALWAVVKADGYGHGAADAARGALEGGATALCVATVGEALALRRVHRDVRIVVLGPAAGDEIARAREARLELVMSDERVPEGVDVHLKLDTGMGRWGLAELAEPGRGVVGLMTHLATADTDPGFARVQLERFLEATQPYARRYARHAATSAAALAMPEARLASHQAYSIGSLMPAPRPWRNPRRRIPPRDRPISLNRRRPIALDRRSRSSSPRRPR